MHMKNKPALVVASLIFAIGLSACENSDTGEKAGKKIDEVATETGKKIDKAVDNIDQKMNEQSAKTAQVFDDAEITTRVKAAILAEPGLRSLQISVDTINGVVTLTGSTDSVVSNNQATSLAMAVEGVKEVVNRLVITPNK